MHNKKIKLGCYITNISMSVVSCLSPILFTTFHELYGISFSLLGLLIFINFITQLIIDLFFTFMSKYFNISKIVKTIPIITITGFLIYALVPLILPEQAYVGLVIGTIVFSASAGLNEVLASPIIAALPSDNKEKDMSFLHATYGFGLVGFVLLGTIFLHFVGTQNWMYLPIICSIIPLLACVMFRRTVLPALDNTSKNENTSPKFSSGILLCALLIFFCGATECTMTQWSSSFVETGLGVSKVLGDLLGTLLFALMLTFGRTIYSRIGKNIYKVMLLSLTFAIVSYLAATLIQNQIISLFACIITGLCVSMLWPGTIIILGDKYPKANVSAYALMASAGDLGGAIIPYLVGIIVDKLTLNNFHLFGATVEQSAMKGGLLFATIFPLLGLITLIAILIYFKRKKV